MSRSAKVRGRFASLQGELANAHNFCNRLVPVHDWPDISLHEMLPSCASCAKLEERGSLIACEDDIRDERRMPEREIGGKMEWACPIYLSDDRWVWGFGR